MIHRSFPVLLCLVCALEIAALGIVLSLNQAVWLPVSLALHLVAARVCVRIASLRREDLAKTERDLVNWMALLVPMFGPTLAWWMPLPPVRDDDEEREEIVNAHEMFERYESHVQPEKADYERTLFTGDYARDLARELDAESYAEVIRHGNTTQKRNALRRLATLGKPRHFALIRACLVDPSHEVRLYAYAELEKASIVFEDEIADLTRRLAKRPKRIDALLAMAHTQFRYASTGIHDEAMAAFYFKTVIRFAKRARDAGERGPEPSWLTARSLAKLGRTDDALEEIATLPPEEQEMPESCLVRAAIRFDAREFEEARVEADRIEAAGGEVPGWLRALFSENTLSGAER